MAGEQVIKKTLFFGSVSDVVDLSRHVCGRLLGICLPWSGQLLG
jgi:hypothetical protein